MLILTVPAMSPKVTFSDVGHWSLFQEKVFASVLTNEDFTEILAVSI